MTNLHNYKLMLQNQTNNLNSGCMAYDQWMQQANSNNKHEQHRHERAA